MASTDATTRRQRRRQRACEIFGNEIRKQLETDFDDLMGVCGADPVIDDAEDSLLWPGEPDQEAIDDAAAAFEDQLSAGLKEAFRAYLELRRKHEDWRYRIAYTFGVAMGKVIGGGR